MVTGSQVFLFIDNILVGDQSVMPDTLKHDKANNKYYMLPFILRLLGMFYQYQRGKQGKKDFWVVMLLFFFTGIAIVLLPEPISVSTWNVTMPMPDRSMPFYLDRFQGSLPVDLLQKKMDSRNAAIIVTAVCPVRRSGKYGSKTGMIIIVRTLRNHSSCQELLSTCAPERHPVHLRR